MTSSSLLVLLPLLLASPQESASKPPSEAAKVLEQGLQLQKQAKYDEAIQLYRAREKTQELVCSLADRGIILGRSGCLEEAVAHLEQALEGLDPRQNPRYYLGTVHNMALYLHDLADSPASNELALAWLRRHRIDPAKVRYLGSGAADRTLAERLGVGEYDEG